MVYHGAIWPALVAVIGMLVAANVVVGALLVRLAHHDGTVPVAAVPLPAISIPIPSSVAPLGRALSPERAQLRQAKVRPPVLLGPKNLAASLTTYCRGTVAGATRARVTADGWACNRPPTTPKAVNTDAACRWLYGKDAWSGMLDDTDQRSWRCYRDPS
jgi:hypothetical protein